MILTELLDPNVQSCLGPHSRLHSCLPNPRHLRERKQPAPRRSTRTRTGDVAHTTSITSVARGFNVSWCLIFHLIVKSHTTAVRRRSPRTALDEIGTAWLTVPLALPPTRLNRPIIMPALDLTSAGRISCGRAHRLDRLSPFIPANLFDSKSLTLETAEQTDWPV